MSVENSKAFKVLLNVMTLPGYLVFGAVLIFLPEGAFWGILDPFGLIGHLAFAAICGLGYALIVTLLFEMYSRIYNSLKSE